MKTDSSSPGIISVHSFKGGTGKTTLTTLLAAALAQRGQEVCILDLDLLAPALATMLGVADSLPGIGEFLFRMQDEGTEKAGPYKAKEVCHRARLPWPGAGDLGVWLVPARADYELARSAQAYLMAEQRSGLLEARVEFLLGELCKVLGITVFLLDLPPSLFGMSGAMFRLVVRRQQSLVLLSTPSRADLRGAQGMFAAMVDEMNQADGFAGRRPERGKGRPGSAPPGPRMAFFVNRCPWGYESESSRIEARKIMTAALGEKGLEQDPALVGRWLANFGRVGTFGELPNWRRLAEVRLREDEPLPSLEQVLTDDVRGLAEWLHPASSKP